MSHSHQSGKHLIAALSFTVASAFLFAQDIHYSQYFNAPLSLNPALTGKVDGTFRVGVSYRNQWMGLVEGRSSYSTPSFFGDVPIRFKSKDILGAGISIISDKTSGGKLSSFSGMIATAYHQAMGKTKNHFFSLGIQFGLLQRRLDLANIRLGDQIDPQHESFVNSATELNNLKGKDSGFDMHFGFDWSSKFSERASMHAGYAAFHITQPSVSFHAGEETLPVRHALKFGGDFGLAKHFRLEPFFLYIKQAKSKETCLGLSAGIPFSDAAGMHLGAHFRIQDAVVPYVGFDIKGFRIGASYDITTSALEKTGGSIEISLMYIGRYVPVPDVVPSLYSPRF